VKNALGLGVDVIVSSNVLKETVGAASYSGQSGKV
jgi:hypothetical protein